jgi:hypothetical protein
VEKLQSNATEWNHFHRIKDEGNRIVNYVQCILFKHYLAYEPKNIGSSTLKNHVSSCQSVLDSPAYPIKDMLTKSNNVPSNMKTYY